MLKIKEYDIPLGIALFSIVIILLGIIIDTSLSWMMVGAGIVWLVMSILVVIYQVYYLRK